MEVIIQPTEQSAVKLTARLLADALRTNPEMVFGLATGATMEAVYAELVRMHREEKLDFTNAKTFTEKLLKLEPYMEWNEYYASLDKDSLQEIENYMNQGKTYRNSSWSIAVTYYEKAYTTANNAYYHFKGKSGKGMKECADFYKSYAVLIDRIINRENITDAESKTYDSAIDNYMNALKDMSNALDDVIAILDSFPAKLY